MPAPPRSSSSSPASTARSSALRRPERVNRRSAAAQGRCPMCVLLRVAKSLRPLLIGLPLLASCGPADRSTAKAPPGAATLYFSNWEGEIGPDTLSQFERRTGIHVVLDDIPDNVSLQTKLLTGHSGSDVVVPSSNFVQPLIEAGALQKLDKSKLANWHHLDPKILGALERVDPGNQYGVPFLWGTHAFAYNRNAVMKALGREPEPSWNLMFDPQNA